MSLFLTTSEFKGYVSLNADTSFNALQPFIDAAQEQYLVPLLGQTFYDSFVTDYGVDASVSGDNIALLPFIQRPLANYAMFLAADQLALNVGNGGIVESRGNNVDPVPKWKFDNLKKTYIAQADLHAEKLLEYLEANAVNGGKYSLWFNSTANTIADGLVVSTVRIASEHIEIDDNRRIFKRMKKFIKFIETNFIQKLIGTAQYDEIVTQIKAGTLNADVENSLLVEKLKPIICKKALFETIPTLRLSINENGITLISTNDGVINQNVASKEDIKMLLWSLKDAETGYEAYTNSLKQFIIDNIEDYPLIEASAAYTSKADPGPKRPPVNVSTNKHFGV